MDQKSFGGEPSGREGAIHELREAPDRPAEAAELEEDVATRKRAAVVVIADRIARSKNTWSLGELQSAILKRDTAPTADTESRQRLEEEVAKWQSRYEQEYEQDLECLMRLYDANPNLVDPDSEESVQAFQEAGAAFIRLNRVGTDIHTAGAMVEAYMAILDSPDPVSVDGKQLSVVDRLNAYAQSIDTPYSSHGYLETLRRLITSVHWMYGETGRQQANRLIAPLRDAIKDDEISYRESFTENSRAGERWLAELPKVLDRLRTMESEELPALLERFLERYASGERLSTLNAISGH